MFPPGEPWKPHLDWDSLAGRALDAVSRHLPRDRSWRINVFGSAPLQMGIEPTFTSGDVDIFTEDDWREVVLRAIAAAGLSRRGDEFYVQCVPEGAFRTSRRWTDRAHVEERGGVTFRFAHPIDILIGKLNRLAPKDLKAFRLVIEKTGHPTESELIAEFQRNTELFSFAHFSPFSETTYWQNTERLWPEVFGRKIDVDREILQPAYAMLREAYEIPDWKADLEKLAGDEPPREA